MNTKLSALEYRVALLMSRWTPKNKARLLLKMEKRGIMQGGILSTCEENLTLFKYLIKEVRGIEA